MQRQKVNKPIVLGLTGSFGTGKSTVAEMFKRLGAKILDADKLAHKCFKPASEPYKKIVTLFGKTILNKKGAINRKKLAVAAFRGPKKLSKLSRIIHPRVIEAIKQGIISSRSKVVVVDAPLLVESGLNRIVDKLIVVLADRNKQIKRLKTRTGLSSPEILKRIAFQLPLEKKARLADFIIDNNGSFRKTRKQVEETWKKVWKS